MELRWLVWWWLSLCCSSSSLFFCKVWIPWPVSHSGLGVPTRQTPVNGAELSLLRGYVGLSELALPWISRSVYGKCCPAFGLCEWAVGQPRGPWPGHGWGWHCLSLGWCLQLPCTLEPQHWCTVKEADAYRSPVSLVTAGRRYFGKEAGSARKSRQVSGDGS